MTQYYLAIGRQTPNWGYPFIMHDREEKLVVRFRGVKLTMAHALADAGDEPFARVARLAMPEYLYGRRTPKRRRPKLHQPSEPGR